MGCTFCATGTLGELGNLTSGEILEQVVHAQRLFAPGGVHHDPAKAAAAPGREKHATPPTWVSGTGRGLGVRNVVFMGMGEPLNNYDEVITALGPMTDPQCFGLAPSRCTVSTVGVIPRMRTLVEDAPGVNLALSLHAPNQTLRERIVPTATAYKLPALMDALDDYLRCGPKVRTMVEYCVLGGVNDTPECAAELGELLKGKDIILNLIPYNPTDVPMGHSPPDPEAVKRMQELCAGAGVFTTVRQEMGQDIAGACGQLALKRGPGEEPVDGVGGDIEDLAGPPGRGKTAVGLRSRARSRKVDGTVVAGASEGEAESTVGNASTTVAVGMMNARGGWSAVEAMLVVMAALSLVVLVGASVWNALRTD